MPSHPSDRRDARVPCNFSPTIARALAIDIAIAADLRRSHRSAHTPERSEEAPNTTQYRSEKGSRHAQSGKSIRPGCNRQSRRLGDFVAGTAVLREKPTAQVRPSWRTSAGTSGPGPDREHVAADELILIETYLHRRWELDDFVRPSTALQIADRINAKTGLQPPPHRQVDDFLEEAAGKIRDSGGFR